ncbi:MAG: signal peptidase I, partial [Eggerthellaceae bacterium]|nr:signal peptidase I [Eggerthellaceae bacterium]
GITPGDIRDFTVPEDCYFVMGDNRVSSIDSRSDEVGLVERSAVRGKAVLRLFPFRRFRKF